MAETYGKTSSDPNSIKPAERITDDSQQCLQCLFLVVTGIVLTVWKLAEVAKPVILGISSGSAQFQERSMYS